MCFCMARALCFQTNGTCTDESLRFSNAQKCSHSAVATNPHYMTASLASSDFKHGSYLSIILTSQILSTTGSFIHHGWNHQAE